MYSSSCTVSGMHLRLYTEPNTHQRVVFNEYKCLIHHKLIQVVYTQYCLIYPVNFVETLAKSRCI